MDIQFMLSSSSSLLYPKTHKKPKLIPQKWLIRNQVKTKTICFFNYKICSGCKWQQRTWLVQRLVLTKAIKRGSSSVELTEDNKPFFKVDDDDDVEKKGTIGGAIALIIGTSIGSGILALPQKASLAGIVPSSITIIACWGFLLFEALLLIEINVGLWKKKRKKLEDEEEGELDVISLRTMAQETLGNFGGTLATITYVFLGYSSMVAYTSKSGEVLYHLINLPESVSGCLFTCFFTMLISIGGAAATDQVNQWLTTFMIGLLLGIEVLAVADGGLSGLEGSADWGKVPSTIPVIIFSLVYHDLTPVLCAYLGGDLPRLRASVLIGGLVPLLALLVWEAIALGLSSQSDQIADPVELLMSVRWSGLSYLVEAFSLLAVGTSLIGSLLGFYEFFKEQLKNLPWHSSTTKILQEPNMLLELRNWWGRNKISFTAMAIVIVPTLLVETTFPDAFSAATDIAGGYCMTMLYGILPPAMAWAMYDREGENTNQKVLSRARPALVGVGIFACGIVLEQILQDFSALHL